MSLAARVTSVFTPTRLAIAAVCLLIAAGLTYLALRKREAFATEKDAVCEVFFFYTAWCPYCKKARPEWDKFKDGHAGEIREGYRLLFTEVDADANETLANKYEVVGYPTIKLVKDGKVTEYDAKPSVATLNQFLDSCFTTA